MSAQPQKIEGRWWVDGRNQQFIPGVLQISSSGLNLRVGHPRSISADQLIIGVARNQDGESVEIIYGEDEHNTPVTLFGCHQVGYNSTMGYCSSANSVSTVSRFVVCYTV